MTNNNNIGKHFLVPSSIFVSETSYRVSTILGSCIAVCLYDPYHNIGGMNHFMLPLWNGDGLATPKYGDIAINNLIRKMENKGSNKHHLMAKVFGGANQSDSSIRIGEKNTQITFDLLKRHNIEVYDQSVGGTKGRKILFYTSTGKVVLKFLERTI